MSTYDHIRCSQCGSPWAEHSPDCPRHDYRPGARVEAPGAAPDAGSRLDGELPHLLRKLADELERSASAPRPTVPVLWCDLTASGLVALAAAEIDRLRATVGRIESEAVVSRSGPALGGRETWEWAVGDICSMPFLTRDEAVAGFRERFGLEGK